MSQNVRKSYRDKLLAAKSIEPKEFEVDGMALKVKSPTRGDYQLIINKSTVDGVVQTSLVEAWAVIKLVIVSGTGEPLFDDEDLDSIQNLTKDSLFEEVAKEAVNTLTGADTDPKS